MEKEQQLETFEQKKQEFVNLQTELIDKIKVFLKQQQSPVDAAKALVKGGVGSGVSSDLVEVALQNEDPETKE